MHVLTHSVEIFLKLSIQIGSALAIHDSHSPLLQVGMFHDSQVLCVMFVGNSNDRRLVLTSTGTYSTLYVSLNGVCTWIPIGVYFIGP